MRKNDFKIRFAGDKHEIDIETLIGCLLHTSNIVQEVNRMLETNKKIEVKIKALEKGSFEIDIELVESLITSLFSSDKVSYVADIIEVVGGLYGFAQLLKGDKPTKIEDKGADVEITDNKGNVTIINGNVYNIYNENENIRNSISKQFGLLENNKDIEGFEFESINQKTYIPQNEFSSIAKKINRLEDKENEPIIEVKEDCKVLIIRPSFSKDLKWDFVFEGQKLSAKMNDQDIIKIIDEGEEFSKGDMMLVDLEITKFYDIDLGVYMITKDSYKIINYKQHIKAAKQGKLFN